MKNNIPDLSGYNILVTGGAGFIGSNIVEFLIKNNVGKVRVADNLSTGNADNLSKFRSAKNFEFFEGDISEITFCKKICSGIDYVLHQAALGSIPRSIKNPADTNKANVTGFLNTLIEAKDAGVKKFVYASSSSVYGDSKQLPKQEHSIGKPLSPYAASKRINELYAESFYSSFGLNITGLRYFNIFGPNQNPKGEYAAAIPLFIESMLHNKPVYINGDGEQTRDFTYVDNAVNANVLALFSNEESGRAEVYNIACGSMLSLNQVIEIIRKETGSTSEIIYREKRLGDIRESLADISKARKDLSFEPQVKSEDGLIKTINWFKSQN